MNFWVLMYLIFAPVFVGVVLVYFNRKVLLKKWWLFRHPQTVYKAIFYYPNRMFVERFISTHKDSFSFKKGTYNINKEALLRKNWLGLKTKEVVKIGDHNCIDFEKYKLTFADKIEDLPDKAQIIGELHYMHNVSNPIIYPDQNALPSLKGKADTVEDVHTLDTALANDQHKVGKSNVISQLINANFQKSMLTILAVLLVVVIIITGLTLGMRMEVIDAPLHAICVNVG